MYSNQLNWKIAQALEVRVVFVCGSSLESWEIKTFQPATIDAVITEHGGALQFNKY